MVDRWEKLKSPSTLAKELEKLVVEHKVACMIVGLPKGYPPSNDMSNEIVFIVNGLPRTGILCHLPYTYIDEDRSSQLAKNHLKDAHKEIQKIEGSRTSGQLRLL
jgi:RNase H-fold protein (predicted Holliday junction resolvase)